MRRIIISTVGTSLLTNTDRNLGTKGYAQLRDTANLAEERMPVETQQLINRLRQHAQQELATNNVAAIRNLSAELNGIYGLYDEELTIGRQDIHFLISTDTYQGIAAANIVKEFLISQQLTANVITPPELSTASTNSFSAGIDYLLKWLKECIPGYRESGYRICFNLVGSFKSLQGYLSSIGMFYADEIIYIFEGRHSELITIPRLPVKVDYDLLQPFVTQIALMDAGASQLLADLVGLPESLIFIAGEEALLSSWGQLIWNESKSEFLTRDLLPFPWLEYAPSFIADYNSIRQRQERINVQETLAKVSKLLGDGNGNIARLREDRGLQYENYFNRIGHFRVNQGLRMSCDPQAGKLQLIHYGTKKYVQGKHGV